MSQSDMVSHPSMCGSPWGRFSWGTKGLCSVCSHRAQLPPRASIAKFCFSPARIQGLSREVLTLRPAETACL